MNSLHYTPHFLCDNESPTQSKLILIPDLNTFKVKGLHKSMGLINSAVQF